MKTIEELLAALQSIIDGAKGEDGSERALTDEEMLRYETTEKELTTLRKDVEIRSRNTAYNTAKRTDLGVHAGGQSSVKRTDEERAFGHYLRTGIPNADLTWKTHPADEFRAQAEGTGSAGGYLVPTGFLDKITEKLKAYGGLASEVETIETDSGNPLPWPTNDDTGNVGAIVAENAAPAGGADLVFGTKSLGAFKYDSVGTGGLPLKVSVELAQDSAFPLEPFISRKLGMRIGRKQATDLVVGAGTTEPLGALTGGTTGLSIATNAVGLTYAEFVAASHIPDVAYREEGECVWVMSDGVAALAESLVDLNGRPLMRDSVDSIAGKPVRTILGYRVVIDNAMPASFAGDITKTMLFGNMKLGYVRRMVKEVTLVVLRELYALNGQIGYMAWARMDGLPQDTAAYTVITAKDV